MKWSVVALILLGIVAAVSAAVLIGVRGGWGRRETKTKPPADVWVLVAAKALPAMTIIDKDCVIKKSMRKKDVPTGYLSDQAQVIGRVVTTPMLDGQAFTGACLAPEGTASTLALKMLPMGMRAVSVSLSKHSKVAGLLYPGCIVDVLATFWISSPDDERRRDFMSKTLLQAVKVLAIENQTVLSADEAKDNPDAAEKKGLTKLREQERRTVVTLQVTPRQAEVLQLAKGAVSLALRNPLDVETTIRDPSWLSELPEIGPGTMKTPAPPVQVVDAGTGAEAKPVPEVKTPAPIKARWKVIVIRGNTTATESFQVATEDVAGQ